MQSIADASGSNTGLVNLTTTYSWDGNGNLYSNTNTTNTTQNKAFTYNLLNLPLVATFAAGTATYTYDATGNKLRKVDLKSGTTTTTDYISGIEYDNSTTTIGFIQTEEGKAVPNGTGYDYEYYLGDNLGNTRVTFGTKTGVAALYQQDDYYPFGLEINRSVLSPKNEYLYNKKELQEEFTEYDYGARFYDPVIGRWNSPDLLAEIAPSLTPYRYCYNNPINVTDPYGLWESTAGGYTTSDPKDIERFKSYMDAESAINTNPSISQISSFVGEEKAGGLGKLTDGSKLLNAVKVSHFDNALTGVGGWKVDQKSFSNFWYQVQGDLTPEASDPRTWHNNIAWLSYAGSNNPKKYNGQEDYSRPPDQIEDVPAYFHDLGYKKIGANGADGLFNSDQAIPLDFKFCAQEMGIGLGTVNPITKIRAMAIGAFVGEAGLFKLVKDVLPHTIGLRPINLHP